MKNYIRQIKSPEYFQGSGRRSAGYFEGWYFKHDIPRDGISYAFIPGISLSRDDTHAFIQVIRSSVTDGLHFTRYFRYPAEKFYADTRRLLISAGDSIFTNEGCEIGIKDDDGFRMSGSIGYGAFTPIRKTVFSPGIMGPFAYVPAMECNHGIISMQHSLSGSLDDNGQRRDFGGGTGYIEKDWGTSFPRDYVWVQCPGFMLSIAHIPFAGASFKGFLCVLIGDDGIEHRFATYNRSHIVEMSLDGSSLKAVIKRPGAILTVEASQRSQGGSILAPRSGKMERAIKECLSASVSIRLTGPNGAVLAEKVCTQASMEVVGNK